MVRYKDQPVNDVWMNHLCFIAIIMATGK